MRIRFKTGAAEVEGSLPSRTFTSLVFDGNIARNSVFGTKFLLMSAILDEVDH